MVALAFRGASTSTGVSDLAFDVFLVGFDELDCESFLCHVESLAVDKHELAVAPYTFGGNHWSLVLVRLAPVRTINRSKV